ncbi:MAG: ATP synthase subunit I [Pseudomonadota bacterium]|nr:ATP synthase subunit I [Pseudomonadota bacterium]
MIIIKSKAIRTVLRWEVYVTLALTILASYWKGSNGGMSALLGGGVNVIAGAAYGFMASRGKPRSVGGTLRTLLRAESTKIALIVLQIWAVFTFYKDPEVIGFFTAFIVTVLIFSLALFASDK